MMPFITVKDKSNSKSSFNRQRFITLATPFPTARYFSRERVCNRCYRHRYLFDINCQFFQCSGLCGSADHDKYLQSLIPIGVCIDKKIDLHYLRSYIDFENIVIFEIRTRNIFHFETTNNFQTFSAKKKRICKNRQSFHFPPIFNKIKNIILDFYTLFFKLTKEFAFFQKVCKQKFKFNPSFRKRDVTEKYHNSAYFALSAQGFHGKDISSLR